MFNRQQEQIAQEFVRNNVNHTQHNSNKAHIATLYLFSPKRLPTQVLRAHQYNFNDQFVSDMVTNKYLSYQRTCGQNGIGHFSSINNAILPDATGVIMDTSLLNEQWSFVLIIDSTTNSGSTRIAASPHEIRIIATGYVVDEPITQGAGYLNPNAILVFNHATVAYLSTRFGPDGMRKSITVSSDVDFVNATVGQLSTEPLFLGTTRELRNSCMCNQINDELVGAYGNMLVSNSGVDEPAKTVTTTLKSPRLHLADLMHTIDNAVTTTLDRSDNDVSIISSIMPSSVDTPMHQQVNDAFDDAAVSSNYSFPSVGPNFGTPMTMSQLSFHYPDINIIPYNIPQNSTWNVKPQDRVTKNNMVSSLIAASLSGIVSGVGLASIIFRYNSWLSGSVFDSRSNKPGTWEIHNCGCLGQVSNSGMKNCIDTFQIMCNATLFPTIKTIGGEFDLMVYYNTSGEILVDLNYMDDGLRSDEGFYETNARLGGILNPLLGTLDIVNNNAAQLHSVVDQLAGSSLGFKNTRGIHAPQQYPY